MTDVINNQGFDTNSLLNVDANGNVINNKATDALNEGMKQAGADGLFNLLSGQ